MTGIFRWIAKNNDGMLEYVTGNDHPAPGPTGWLREIPQDFLQAVETGQVRSITDIASRCQESRVLEYYAAHHVQALLIAPLSAGEAFSGLLILGFSSPHRCTREDEFLLRAFADGVCSTLYGNHAMQHLEQSIFNREQELAILYDIASISNETADLNIHTILKKSLDRVLEFSKFHSGVIHLFGNGHRSLKNAAVIRSYTNQRTRIIASVQQVLFQKASEKKNQYLLETLPDGDMAYFGIPILARGHMLGLFSLFGRRDLLHTPETIHLIKSIVGQLGLVVENTQHRKQAENALVLHERQRLARDLHDSITQSLYGLAISGDIGRKMLERGEYGKLSQTMENICDVSLQAMKEMRLMLFELRPLALEKEGLIQALNLRLETVERRAGMDVSLTVMDNVLIPYPIEVDLYHLATEALNNSLKHSGARCITVSIGARQGCLFMEIADDGQGFDLAKVPRGGIGLTGMNERARRLGGTINICSEPGKGTRIQINICLEQKF
jgi:signal transduction histidine kinase